MDGPDATGLDPKRRAQLVRRLEDLGLELEALDPRIRERVEQRARRVDARTSIGRYLLLGELGRGGMGVVYEAFDPEIERHVAIKTLEPDLVPEEERAEVVARFRRETKIVGRLEHPSIVTVFDVGLERTPLPAGGGHEVIHFYVMEFLEGRSLSRVLREEGPLAPRRAVEVARSMAEALGLAHEAGVIHRDIKPSNVFLRERGDAVLLDFGIAKSGSVALTRQGQILGTPSYLAPERLREKEAPIDGRADLFSLGVLIYTMITGEAPFVGADVYEIIDKIAKEAHPQLGGATRGARALEEVVDRLLAKRPVDRFDDARSLAAALAGVLRALDADETQGEVRVPAETADLEQAHAEGAAPEAPSSEETTASEMEGEDDSPSTAVSPRPSGLTPAATAASPGAAPGPAERPAPRASGYAATRPELALLRETRELGHDGGPWAADVTLSDGEVDEETVADGAFREHLPPSLGGRSRIEVSLVDEADVVVQPAPLGPLDEAPTQAAFPPQGEEPSEAPGAALSPRSALSPPAEGPSEAGPALAPPGEEPSALALPGEGPSESPEAAPGAPTRAAFSAPKDEVEPPRERPGTPPRAHRPLSKGIEDAEPMILVPARSERVGGAAVARQTFGKSTPPAPRAVSVRVSGARLDEPTLERERRRSRRRWGLLVSAVFLSIGTGLALGRFGGRLRGTAEPAAPEEAEAPPVPAAAARPRSGGERSASSLISDAEAARTAGELARAETLYAEAAAKASERDDIRARARLGRADVLRSLGRAEDATAMYRAVLSEVTEGPVASQARVALSELERPRPAPRAPASGEPPPRAASSKTPEARVTPAPPRRLRRARTPEAACREILFRHVADPKRAVAEFRALAERHPDASCAHWNLGVKSEMVGDFERAARAYRRYLQLVPNTRRRDAVERRIENLEARLR